MTVFELALPFLAATLGAFTGLALRNHIGLNAYLTIFLFAHAAVSPFLVLGLRVVSKRKPPHTGNGSVLLTLICSAVATCAALPALALALVWKINAVRRQLEG